MKTFIQNNKRKLLLILTAVLIVCTFSGFMLTASAFTIATGWTVTYRTDCEAIISTTTEDLDTVTASRHCRGCQIHGQGHRLSH